MNEITHLENIGNLIMRISLNIFDIFQYCFRKVTTLFAAIQLHTSKILNKTYKKQNWQLFLHACYVKLVFISIKLVYFYEVIRTVRKTRDIEFKLKQIQS